MIIRKELASLSKIYKFSINSPVITREGKKNKMNTSLLHVNFQKILKFS